METTNNIVKHFQIRREDVTDNNETDPLLGNVDESPSYDTLLYQLEEKNKEKKVLDLCIDHYKFSIKDMEEKWADKIKTYGGCCFRDGYVDHYVLRKNQDEPGKLKTIAINESYNADRIEKTDLYLNKDWSLLDRYVPISKQEFKARLTDKISEFLDCLEKEEDNE